MTLKNLRVARTVSQVVFFLLLVVFLVGTFCSVRLGSNAYLTCSLGMLQFALSSGQLIGGTIASGVVLLVVTLLLGRVFCGWICPFGALLDWLQKPLARLRRDRGKVLPALLNPDNRSVKYGVLAGVLGSAAFLKYPAFCAICPVGTTCRTAGLQGVNLGLETAVLPIVASLDTIQKRFWCKTLCPIGALLGIVSRYSFFKVRLPWDRCTGCKRCEQACAMDNAPHASGHERLKTDPEVIAALFQAGLPDLLDRPGKYSEYPKDIQQLLDQKNRKLAVRGAECTRCLACAAACPVKNQQAATPLGSRHASAGM